MDLPDSEIISAIARAVASELKNAPADRWIRGLRAASQYAKINRPQLEALLRSGEIRGYIDNDSGKPTWRIDRDSIDAYHNRRIDGDQAEIDKKVVAFLGRKNPR